MWCILGIEITFPSLQWFSDVKNPFSKLWVKMPKRRSRAVRVSVQGAWPCIPGPETFFKETFIGAEFEIDCSRYFSECLWLLKLNSNQCQVKSWVTSWIILHFPLVENQASSETTTLDLPRHQYIKIFENTSLIDRLTTLFQNSDPTLRMMPTIWKSMCLAACTRKSDRNHLLLSMQDHPNNQKFLETLAACLIHEKIKCARSTSRKRITTPHVDRIRIPDKLITDATYPSSQNWNGEEYLS